ncbi:MAG: lysylphosphatidylglycerol synthase transmembrane domain-containing protein [Erysipelotrichaceae bacterium]
MKKLSKNYLLNFLLIIFLTMFALWFALKDNFDQVIALLSQVSWIWFVIILAWGIGYTLIIGWILTVLARNFNKDYKLKDGILNGFIGSFFSGITPSSTGGQFAQIYIFKKQGIKTSDAASLLWADFIIYQATMIAYVTVLFILRFTHYLTNESALFIFVFIGYLINSTIIVLLGTMAKFPKIYVKLSSLIVKLLHKLHLVKDEDKTIQNWTIQLNSFTIEINKLKKNKRLIVKVVLLNLLRLTVWFSLPYVIGIAIQADMHLSKLIDVIACSSFVSMSNTFFPVPGATGGTEVVFTAIFQTNHIMNGMQASSTMILWRFSTYHMILIIGGCMFMWAKRKYDQERWSELDQKYSKVNEDQIERKGDIK